MNTRVEEICWRILVPTFEYYITNSWREGVKAGENFSDCLTNVAHQVVEQMNNEYEYNVFVNYCLDSDDELLTILLSYYLRKVSQLDNLKLYIKNVTNLDAFRTLIEENIL